MSQRNTGILRLIFIATLFLCIVCGTDVLAQQWIAIGPTGRPTLSKEADPSSRSAIGNGRIGALRFLGKGRHRRMAACTPFDGIRIANKEITGWNRPSMIGMPAIGVADIASFDRRGRRLMALTGDADGGLDPDYPAMNSESVQSRGIYFSADGGENWTGPAGEWHRSDGTVDPDFWKYPSLKIGRRLLVSLKRKEPWFMVVFTCRYATRGFDSWVYRSTDRGKNWHPVLYKEDGWFKDLYRDPLKPSRIYCSGRSVYRSDDDGITWADIGRMGLPPDSLVNRCLLSFCGQEPGAMYVLVNRKSGYNELYRLAHSDDTLRKLVSGAISPPWRTAFVADPQQRGRFFFSGGNRVNVFESLGDAWRTVAAGAGPHDDIHELQNDPAAGSVLVSTDGGLFSTMDGGKQWSDLSAGLDVLEAWGVSAADDSGRLVVLCGTQDCGTIRFESGSHPDSAGWSIVRGGDGMKPIICKADPNTMYANDGNNNLLHLSNDGGKTWRTVSPQRGSRAEYLRPLVEAGKEGSTLMTGYQDLFLSQDRGSTWKPLRVPGTGTISAIAISSSDTSVYYCAFAGPSWSDKVNGRLFRSMDGGQSWIDISPGLKGASWAGISSVAVSPSDPLDVMVGFRGGSSIKVMRSLPGATVSWKDVSAGMPGDADVNGLLFDSRPGKKDVYAATHQGVFKFKDSVGSWSDFNGTMDPVLVADLDIEPISGTLIAGTHGRGIWMLKLE